MATDVATVANVTTEIHFHECGSGFFTTDFSSENSRGEFVGKRFAVVDENEVTDFVELHDNGEVVDAIQRTAFDNGWAWRDVGDVAGAEIPFQVSRKATQVLVGVEEVDGLMLRNLIVGDSLGCGMKIDGCVQLAVVVDTLLDVVEIAA